MKGHSCHNSQRTEREERVGFYQRAFSFFCFCLENESIHSEEASRPSQLLSSGEMLSQADPEVGITDVLGISGSNHTDAQDEPSQ